MPLSITAHISASGHRSREYTERHLASQFQCDTLCAVLTVFIYACTPCLSTSEGKTVPSPCATSLLGTAANHLLQIDYIDVEHRKNINRYFLMLRVDLSDYCWLFASPSMEAWYASQAINDGCAAFGVPKGLMYDSQHIVKMKS